jgi:two-component system chemotaxis sensor kinase CheA
MSAPLDFEHLRHVFVDECNEGLDSIAESLIALEADPTHPDARHAVFRVAHTVKGGASIVGFACVAEYAHLFEDALEPLRASTAPVTALQITLLLRATDALRTMLAAEASGREIKIREDDRRLLLQLASGGTRGTPAAGHPAVSAAPRLADDATSDIDRRRAQALRVGMDKLDAMLTLSGEIAVAQQRLQQQLQSGAAREEALFSVEELDRVLSELQERVMQLRLVELGPVFRPHLRTVRDIAAMQGKQVRLELDGEDVEVDASIVHQLRDPLLHMIRNAVDHGVESRATRAAAGKPECATVRLRAAHERGNVVITVEDDGGGLRRDRLLATARARGMLAADAEPSDAELHALILEPGFSTADTITQLSGRGVGMDVVRQNVESLRGSLSLRSEEGVGTTVTLRLPLTIAIIGGFLVGVGGECYVIPSEAVCECLAVTEEESSRVTGVLNVRGIALPYARLGAFFGVPASLSARRNLVVVQHDGRQFGLVVDRLLGERQAVLKPLDRLFDRVPGVSGSTILGDGRVSLILDMSHLAAMLDTSTPRSVS